MHTDLLPRRWGCSVGTIFLGKKSLRDAIFPMSMATDNTSLIDGRVSVEQCKKAVSALLQHIRHVQKKAEETELLPGKEQHVWLVMTVKRMQPMKNLKPQRM